MAASPANFYLWFLIVSIILWMIFSLITWKLNRVFGGSVWFRVGSWNCLQDFVVKYEKGTVESVYIGEIKISSLNPLLKLGVGFLFGDSKMQLLKFLISDLEVVMRFSAGLFCDQLSFSSESEHERGVGMVIDDVKIVSGDVILIIDEGLFPKREQSSDEVETSTTTSEKQLLTTLAKYLPDKVSFSLTNLDVRYVNRGLVAQNYTKGIELGIVKVNSVEDIEESTTHLNLESTRLDVHIDLNEIHFFREAESSVLEITKVDLVASIIIPVEPVLPIKAGVHIKLDGTRCKLLVSRLQPWLQLQEGTHPLQNSGETAGDTDMRTIMWTGTVSAPVTTVRLYSLNDLPLYHFCSQSTSVLASRYLSMYTSIDVELGEMNLHLIDEYQNPNSVSLMNIAKLSLCWGRRDGGASSSHEVGIRSKVTVGVTRMGFDFSFTRLESLITNAMSVKALFQTLYVGTNQTGGVELQEASRNKTTLVYLHLDRCCVNFSDNRIIDDPSSLLNYGTRGGCLRYSISLEISRFILCINKDSTKMKLERVKSIYQEHLDHEHQPCTNVIFFDMLKLKHVRQSRGLNKIDVSASDISLGWEPSAHLSLYEMFMRFRFLVYNNVRDGGPSEIVNPSIEKEYIFGMDLKMMTISAEVGDGVEIKLQAQSISSEDVCIGVLLEGVVLALNGSRVFKSTRMEMSKTTNAIPGGPWHWVVEGLDVHICMPYKLPLYAIAYSIKEMFQGLRVLTGAIEASYNFSEPNTPELGSLRFCIQKLTAYIEEEPIQGWLDEHYKLVKKEACELAVRLKYLEDFIHKASNGGEIFFNKAENDVEYPLDINKEKEKIRKRSFQSYYRACQRLVPSEGSGACREGFHAGFKPSAARTSLLSVVATDFDLCLKAVHHWDASLVEVLKNLHLICQEKSGNNVDLKTGSLVVKLRDYTLPLFSANSVNCKGLIVTFPIAQQTKISQVLVGRWRKVEILRQEGHTTTPMKMYSDLRILFENGEVSFGVGYEPAFVDISYAFTVAMSHKNPGEENQSLPWWDYMRNYFHGKTTLSFLESKWIVLATTDPYESQDKLQIVTGLVELEHSDGRVFVYAKGFKIKLSSLESLISRHSLEVPVSTSRAAFIEAPVFSLEITMDWGCDSGNSLDVPDQLRATSLSLQWNLSFRPENSHQSSSPTINLGAHDLAWILKLQGMISNPPHNLRSFSTWPIIRVPVEKSKFCICHAFGPKIAKSENLSLDLLTTEFLLRVDATPFLIKYMPWKTDDPAEGLIFSMEKLKYELCCSRGRKKYTFECKRDDLDLVYQGLDLHVLNAFINKDEHPCTSVLVGEDHKRDGKHRDEGFLLSFNSLTMKRQAPKADPGSEIIEHTQSDPSDNDGNNVFIADNCQQVFVYCLKILWTIGNRDGMISLVEGISEAFEPPPSRRYKQSKILEENQRSSTRHEEFKIRECGKELVGLISMHHLLVFDLDILLGSIEKSESEEGGTRHFIVNFIEPRFNLHTEEANGRFLLAAVSGHILVRSFQEMIEHALGTRNIHIPECNPEKTWERRETSVMLKHVQAHVPLTNIDPEIPTNSSNLMDTGALLERVFKPCDMYLRYTEHKGGTSDLKVKPLREIAFNSPNITATMTSRQFQVMLDVLTNLLFARLPKPRKSSLQFPTIDDDDDVEEEADQVVPYDVKEVGLAKIKLEEKEQENKLLLDDIRKLSHSSNNMDEAHMERESELWMISTRRSILVQGLNKELLNAQKSRKMAYASLRIALQKENKSLSYAMCISLQIKKVVWSMLADGRSFVEAEINDLMFNFDGDFKDIAIARFTIKYFAIRNCLPNAKSDMLLSAWNPPPKWRKKVMLRVNAKQGAPKDGKYPLELFHVEIYPLRINLTETIYTMTWEYFLPKKEHDSTRRQEVRQMKAGKSQKKKKCKPGKMKFHNVKISPVELLVNYEPRICIKDMRFLMDTFHRVKFTGTWGGLFFQVKKHMIWGVVKSFTRMLLRQINCECCCVMGKNNRESSDNDLNLSDNYQHLVTWFKHQTEGAGDEFITSIQALFNTQRGKGKSILLSTTTNKAWNDFDSEKFRTTFEIGSTSQQRESLPSSRETTATTRFRSICGGKNSPEFVGKDPSRKKSEKQLSVQKASSKKDLCQKSVGFCRWLCSVGNSPKHSEKPSSQKFPTEPRRTVVVGNLSPVTENTVD